MQDLNGPVALFGGVYNNYLALQALVDDATARGAKAIYFLGDTGGFGPHPDRSVELLRELPIISMAGNYDDSIGHSREDCACGYTDPSDNHYAQISYDYTLANTNQGNRRWLAALPASLAFRLDGRIVKLCHGSPRRQNEFLWESTTPARFIDYLTRAEAAHLICCTHTGIHWERRLDDGRGVINVGAIGRPANDGNTHVWYTLLHSRDGRIVTEFVPLSYDHERLAREMDAEGLPPAFSETIRTGWWTTCLEALPTKERARGRF